MATTSVADPTSVGVQHHTMFIGGESVDSDQRYELRNPATGEVFATVAKGGIEHADRAVENARAAFESGVWSRKSPEERSAVMKRVADRLATDFEELMEAETLANGATVRQAGGFHVGLASPHFMHFAELAEKFQWVQQVPTVNHPTMSMNTIQYEPIGVCVGIVPWNFPLVLGLWKAAPALAAGNCVVLKPASLSPLTAMKLGELAHAAGLPPGVLQVLPGSGSAIGDALVTHPLVRKVSFTGSTGIGRRIMELASRDLKRISLELGGKSPNIVFADADWQRAAETSPMSVFANTGQDCCARSRVFVERSVCEAFVDRFIAATKLLLVGDPAKPETQLGPLVSAAQRATVEEFLADARQRGSRFACGGGRPRTKGYYLEPTVLLEVRKDDRCWREEIFGPVVCIAPFDDEAQMIRDVNASPYGLSGSLWTNDLRRALRVAKAVESGVLSVNSHSSVHAEAPFGGFKQSGIGRDLGMAAMDGYTELKNVYVAE